MVGIGIDIGTTTISFTVLDHASGKVSESRTIPYNAWLGSKDPRERMQNPDAILRIVCNYITIFCSRYANIAGIGISCQMHGFLYIKESGQAASPFYTWMDSRGEACAQELSAATGTPVASGYGMATHLYNIRHGMVPPEARHMVTIGDYVGQQLCGQKENLISAGNAASWGGYDRNNRTFMLDTLQGCGIDCSFLPAIGEDHQIIGLWNGKVPVTVALGDNQASFLGSLPNPDDPAGAVLVNVGTGAQVTMGCLSGGSPMECRDLEIRPCLADLDLCVGSSLCGGRAYALLENFYRDVFKMGGHPEADSLYESMAAAMADVDPELAPVVEPTFAGTRSDPSRRASISGLTVDNFTPGYLAYGMLEGIAEELFSLYRRMPAAGMASHLIGSGNGIRKNPVLRRILEEKFGMPLRIPAYEEEAAYGAARYALSGLNHF